MNSQEALLRRKQQELEHCFELMTRYALSGADWEVLSEKRWAFNIATDWVYDLSLNLDAVIALAMVHHPSSSDWHRRCRRYALRRFYDHRISKFVESVLASAPGVEANPDPTDPAWDVRVHDVELDVKVSSWPANFPGRPVTNDSLALLDHLHTNAHTGRETEQNRLYFVLYSLARRDQAAKSNLPLLREAALAWLDRFTPDQFVTTHNGYLAWVELVVEVPTCVTVGRPEQLAA